MSEWEQKGFVVGLKVRMATTELAVHLRTRSEHHKQRANEKESQLPKLREAADAIRPKHAANVSNFGKGASAYAFDGDSAVEQVERDIADHRNKSVAFAFLSEHLFGQDYCLDQNDLISLEILKRS